MRRFVLDDAELLFDRSTGLTIHRRGPSTAGLVQIAPRLVQFGITNACNLSCGFCSRDRHVASTWTAADAFDVLDGLARAGTMEVAFGGGEPLAFRGFDALVARLHEETPLAVGVTTNGLLLTKARALALGRYVSQIRVSIYDDNEWRRTLDLLSDAGASFGVNVLVRAELVPRALIGDLAAIRDVVTPRGARMFVRLFETSAAAADLLAGMRARRGGAEVERSSRRSTSRD